MYTIARFHEIDKIQVSVTITQTLKEWKNFLEQLDDRAWPSCDLTRQIREVIRKADSTFMESSDNGGDDPT